MDSNGGSLPATVVVALAAMTLIGTFGAALLGGLLTGVVSPWLTGTIESQARKRERMDQLQLDAWINVQDAANAYRHLVSKIVLLKMAHEDTTKVWADAAALNEPLRFEAAEASYRLTIAASRVLDEDLRKVAMLTQASLVQAMSAKDRKTCSASFAEAYRRYRELEAKAGTLIRSDNR